MKYFHLIWSALFRKRARTVFTLISILTAFLLFGLLNTVRESFTAGSRTLQGAQQLVVASRFSLMSGLPISLQQSIARVPGVRSVAHENYFAAVYQDPKNSISSYAINQTFLDQYDDDVVLAPAQRQAFANTRDGALIGEGLAARYHWKIGDKIPLQSQRYPRKNGDRSWPFTIVGIFRTSSDAPPSVTNQMFFFHWEYFDEANVYGRHDVSWYMVTLTDPRQAIQVAHAIDGISANSAHETKTQTMNQYMASYVSQIGNIGLIVEVIMGAVFFTLMLLTANTTTQALRERIPELAVLKTIGFSNRSVLGLVLAESLLLLLIGGMIGLAIASAVAPALAGATHGVIRLSSISIVSWAEGIALMIVIGILVGVLPAWRGMRLRIVDALADH